MCSATTSVRSKGQLYHPAKPAFRLFDSRSGSGGMLANHESRTLTMPTIDGVAPTKMRAVVVNVTAVGSTGPGHLSVFRAGSARPSVFTLRYSKPASRDQPHSHPAARRKARP